MNDLLLWELLDGDSIDLDRVVPLLDELPGSNAFAFLGRLDACLTHASPEARGAAVGVIDRYFEEAKKGRIDRIGLGALRRLNALLDDPDERVRSLAAGVFARHAKEPDDFLLAMFHHDPVVRKAFVEAWVRSPETLRYLLTDDATALDVAKRYGSDDSGFAKAAAFFCDCLSDGRLTIDRTVELLTSSESTALWDSFIDRVFETGMTPDRDSGSLLPLQRYLLGLEHEFAAGRLRDQLLEDLMSATFSTPERRLALFAWWRQRPKLSTRSKGLSRRTLLALTILREPARRASLSIAELGAVASLLPAALSLDGVSRDEVVRAAACADPFWLASELFPRPTTVLGDLVDASVAGEDGEREAQALVWTFAIFSSTPETLIGHLDTWPRATEVLANHPRIAVRLPEWLELTQTPEIWTWVERLARAAKDPSGLVATCAVEMHGSLRFAPSKIIEAHAIGLLPAALRIYGSADPPRLNALVQSLCQQIFSKLRILRRFDADTALSEILSALARLATGDRGLAARLLDTVIDEGSSLLARRRLIRAIESMPDDERTELVGIIVDELISTSTTDTILKRVCTTEEWAAIAHARKVKEAAAAQIFAKAEKVDLRWFVKDFVPFWHDEPTLARLRDRIDSLDAFLQAALLLPTDARMYAFRAAHWVHGVWRWREPPTFNVQHEVVPLLARVVCSGTVGEVASESPYAEEPLGEALRLPALEMLERAAGFVARAPRATHYHNVLTIAGEIVRTHADSIPESFRKRLSLFIDLRGIPSAPGVDSVSRAEPLSDDADREEILGACSSPLLEKAFPAAEALASMGEEAALDLVRLLQRGVPHSRELIDVVFASPFIAALRATLAFGVRTRGLNQLTRFLSAVRLADEGDTVMRDLALEIVNEPPMGNWFGESDWMALQKIGHDEARLVQRLVESPQYHVQTRVVTLLVTDARFAGTPPALDALERYLACGTDRVAKLRTRAATALATAGRWRAACLVFSPDEATRAIVELCPPGVALAIARATTWLPADKRPVLALALIKRRHPPDVHLKILEVLSLDAPEAWVANHATRELFTGVSRIAERHDKVARVARVFAWGVRTGRELTGKTFRLRITPTEVAYTYLHQRSIFINPLPILRGDDRGDEIVRGMILHEIGHHRYNSGTEWQGINETAQKEGVQSLLNLVQDEHLERNLRAVSDDFGDPLKTTASWVFRRWQTAIRGEKLLEMTGVAAFEILSSTTLEPARSGIRVRLGALLAELEKAGGSFARFMPALRLGLGNRTGDEKVGRGLALFTKRFRSSTPEDMLEIARELSNIFGIRQELIEIAHDAFHPDDGWDEDMQIHGAGISDDEVQAEVERILRDRKAPRSTKDQSGRMLNVGDDDSFEKIVDIVPVAYDPSAAKAYSTMVLRWSRHLRAAFEQLGMAMVTDRRRLSGRAVDRGALVGAMLRGDPRVLTARHREPKSDIFIGVVIDCSGSMASGESLEKAKSFAQLIADAAKGLRGVDARFFGFRDTVIFDAGDAERCAAHGLEAEGGNNDAAALWHAAKVAMASRRSARLLVMISDGLPTECSVEALRKLVHELSSRMKIACAQVAVQPLEEESICFPKYVELLEDDLSFAVRKFAQIALRLVRSTIGGG